MPTTCTDPLHAAAWEGISAAFAAIGRAFISLDRDYAVLHASESLDSLLGPGAAEASLGRPISELVGEELFAPESPLRQSLEAGQRREGWRASLRVHPVGSCLVSLTAAPFGGNPHSGVCDPNTVYVVVMRRSEDEIAERTAPMALGSLIARSAAMGRIFKLILDLDHSEATVLVTGESGTGKELVARAVHEHSPRRDGPFVAVNCGALPPDLLESELFGHVRGAFTGAVRDREGRFEAASNGTLFLDEVAEIPLQLQVKLLRVLQEGTFERVGESATRQSSARIVAATNVDLARAVNEGRMRRDLFYRLRVVPIDVPPLRTRREDIEPLAQALLARVGARRGRALRLSPSAMQALLDHPWPGNVRELENALEYAVAVCREQTIHTDNLPAEVIGRAPLALAHAPAPVAIELPVASPERRGERAELEALLDRHRWCRRRTAEALGISRTTLWRRMRELGLR